MLEVFDGIGVIECVWCRCRKRIDLDCRCDGVETGESNGEELCSFLASKTDSRLTSFIVSNISDTFFTKELL